MKYSSYFEARIIQSETDSESLEKMVNKQALNRIIILRIEYQQQQILGLHGVATGNKTVKETSDKTPVIKEKPNAYNSEGMFDNKQTEEDEFVKIDLSDDEELDVSDWMLS